MIGLERAINRRIARVDDPAERRILRSYGTWRHLRRLRTVADRQPITADQVVYACNAVTAAAGLLNWLHGRGQQLATCTQDDIDDWLAIDAFSRSRGFVTWAVGCGHAHNIEVPPFNNEPVREVLADHDQRWSLARQLLHDDSIALPDRVAGLLVLLYAQRAARITHLTTGNITLTDDGVELLLGQAPIIVPEAFGDLLEALVNDRRATATGSQDEVWLYPAPRLGQPLAPRSLLQRLRALGVQATLGRNTALMEMAGEMPAVVIAKLLGISLHRATRWTQDAGNTRLATPPRSHDEERHEHAERCVSDSSRSKTQPVPVSTCRPKGCACRMSTAHGIVCRLRTRLDSVGDRTAQQGKMPRHSSYDRRKSLIRPHLYPLVRSGSERPSGSAYQQLRVRNAIRPVNRTVGGTHGCSVRPQLTHATSDGTPGDYAA